MKTVSSTSFAHEVEAWANLTETTFLSVLIWLGRKPFNLQNIVDQEKKFLKNQMSDV